MDARVVGFPNPFKKPGKSDAKNSTSPSTPPPATTNPPEKAESAKSPSPSSPEDSSPDVSDVPIPAVLPPSWNPLLGNPKNNKNLTPPSPPSPTVTPANSSGEERSPPSEQFSPPAPISASSDPKQQPNSNNPASVSGSSTDPILPLPRNSGVDPDPSPSSGGSGGDLVPPANQTAEPSRPHWALHPEMVVGFTLAAVCLVGLIALLMMALIRKTKKKRGKSATLNHNPYVKSDGYYEGGLQKQPKGGNVSGSSHNEGGSMGSPTVLGGVTFFSYEDLMEITNGFASQNLIGEGGFGCVFKGSLPSGRPVAVKQLRVGGRQGEKEFRAEVDIISRIHHRHLVSLVGYCISDKERILIYEFVPNNNLEHHLHGTPVLDWANRVKIALGAAKGLAYLHEDCSPKVIHRDIKSANILLDNSFEAKVADFGLAKLAIESKSHVSTRVMGTFGYMAPEYANSGKLTDRSDVFSFGVVLLELVTGRKPVDPTQPLGEESLVEWARPLLLHTIQTGDCGELVDPRLENHYEESKMIIMIEAAAACIRHSAPKRPRMVQVMRALDTDDGMSDLSNGLKYGQSITYDSGQYDEDILNFRMSRFDSSTGTNESLEQSCGAASSADFTSGESETRAFSSSFGHYQRSNSRGRQFK